MGNATIFSGLYSSQIASADMCRNRLLMVKELAELSWERQENLWKLAWRTHYVFIIKQPIYYVCISAQGLKENVHSWNLF